MTIKEEKRSNDLKTLNCAILGYGNRGSVYADLLYKTDGVKITAVCDVSAEAVKLAKEKYGLRDDCCFTSEDEFFKARRGDACVIATMDKLHVRHASLALALGYDVLLEKPIATSYADCLEIERVAEKHGNKILVCHVLRYTAFFRKIKELLEKGEIGRITSVSEAEDVDFVHYWLSFLHGNWHNEGTSSPIILQKCCHDFDIIGWLTGKKCARVSSFASLNEYLAENKPADAAEYCIDCPRMKTCEYSGIRIMCNNPQWLKGYYPEMEMTDDGVKKVLSDKSNPFSKCAYFGGNDVMTDQIVNMYCEDGVLVQTIMSGFSSGGRREITIHATRGEIYGFMGAEKVYVKYKPFQQPEQLFDLTEDSVVSGHGGGDENIIKSFVGYVRDGVDDGMLSTIEDSILSHKIAFAAEESRHDNGKSVEIR